MIETGRILSLENSKNTTAIYAIKDKGAREISHQERGLRLNLTISAL